MSKLLEVNNLNINFNTYAGVVKAVRNVNFELEKGEMLAIVGESGSGKSVTAKSLMSLLPEKVADIDKKSQILFEGRNILELSNRELRKIRGKEISMVFQDPMTSLNPTMKLGKQISEVLKLHRNMSSAEAKEEAIKIFKAVHMTNPEQRINQYPFELSGGMRQRVIIAMAIACNPKVIIADEPTTALDVTIQAQIMELIHELKEEMETAIILITHDLGVVREFADRINVMYAGKIIEGGTVEEVFKNSKHPYTWALLKSMPALDSDIKSELYALGGTPPDLLDPPIGCPFCARCEYAMEICREEMPERTDLSKTHFTHCWLTHEYAEEV
ncbi:ABC transporter ATP-binding protein [uncultured Clostridium sp.]|uniref:ABC transporter ATP-binding protein n=1 Tax=uncultured Clostridium sp. TaxID=59620 RepID=UPI002623F799|nr:ABC transporter ATP-binding protein [uncultured Clostridium sp.]